MVRRRVDHERFLGVVGLEACSHEVLVEKQGGLDPWPSFRRKNNSLQSHIQVTPDLIYRMLLADIRIRKRPEEGVERHEKGLGENPGEIDRPRGNLLSMHPNIKDRGIVTLSRCIDRRLRDLR